VVTETAGTAAATVMEKDLEAVCGVALESCTCKVNVNVPDWVGVPLTVAVELLRVTPAGRAPEVIDQL
jgi:hypothetical protein